MNIKIRIIMFYSMVMFLICNIFSANAQSTNVIDEHFMALKNHDVRLLAQHYADGAQIFSPSWEGAKIGPAGITEAYSRYFATSPDLTYVITNTIKAGNVIVVEYTSTGTMVKPEKGEPSYMDGKKYTLKNCSIFTIQNNKIIKENTYFDQVAFLRQVGFFDQK